MGVAGMSGFAAGGVTGTAGNGPPIVVSRMPSRTMISSGVMAGLLRNKVNPVYPAVARAAHVSGTVVLHAIIGKDGLVEQVQAVSGPAMLQGAALDAVKQWTYSPYLLNGRAVEVDTTVIVNFGLGGTPDPGAGALPPATH